MLGDLCRFALLKNNFTACYAPVNTDINKYPCKLKDKIGEGMPQGNPGSHGQPFCHKLLYHAYILSHIFLNEHGTAEENHAKPEKQRGFPQHFSQFALFQKLQVPEITLDAFPNPFAVFLLYMHWQIDADDKIITAYFPDRFNKIVNKILVQVFLDI